MDKTFDVMDKPWMAAESASGTALMEEELILQNYDRIDNVGPNSVKELCDDLCLAEKEMKDIAQWGTLNNFLSGFKRTHAAWFK